MAHKPEVKRLCRDLYVTDKLSIEQISARTSVSPSTLKAWKRQATNTPGDWDTMRAASRIGLAGMDQLAADMIDRFVPLFFETLKTLEQADIGPVEKSETLVRLMDAYSKLTASIAKTSPRLERVSFAMDILKELAQFIQRPEHIDHAGALLAVLEPFGDHIQQMFG